MPHLLGVLETVEDRSPLSAWALDRLDHLTTVLELSCLTRMHYAVPERLKEYGVSPRDGPCPPLDSARRHRSRPHIPIVTIR